MTDQDLEKVRQRIGKLLALGKHSATNANEAAVALEKAQALEWLEERIK